MSARAPGPMLRQRVLGVVLCGGVSSRFGADKAIALLGGQRLLDRIVARARPQVGRIAMSGTDRGLKDVPVIVDALASEGPLTGVLSSLWWARAHEFDAVMTFPCDAPFFPRNVVERLSSGLQENAGCALACLGGNRHPAFALWRVTEADAIKQRHDAGERSLAGIQKHLGTVPVEFDAEHGPGGDVFFNINRAADLAEAEAWLKEHPEDP